MGTSTEIPPEVREETGRRVAESKTGLFDTHPCDADRIRAAEALDAPGVFRSTDPATALFRDFASLSRQVTRLSYEKDQALPIQDANLVDTETYLRETRSLRATRALSERYFAGVSTVFHPISIGLPELQPLSDPEAGLAELRSARDRMKAAVTRARYAQEAAGADRGPPVQGRNALVLLTAGFTIEPAQFGLRAATLEAAEVITRLEDQRKRSGARFADFSLAPGPACGRRCDSWQPLPGGAHRRRADAPAGGGAARPRAGRAGAGAPAASRARQEVLRVAVAPHEPRPPLRPGQGGRRHR